MDGTGSGIEGNAKATCTGNRANTCLGLEKDIRDNRSVVVSAKNRTDVGSSLGGDTKDNRLAVVGVRNRTGTELDPGRDTKDDGLAVMNAENRTNTGLALEGDIRDDGLVGMNDRLAVRDDRLAIDNDKSAVGIDKKMEIDDRSDIWVGNQLDGNIPNLDLILTIMGDIKANLIKDFNNSVPLVVSAKSSCIVLDKHAIDSHA